MRRPEAASRRAATTAAAAGRCRWHRTRASMRVLAGRLAVERPPHPFEWGAGFLEAISQRAVSERDDVGPVHMDVAMEIADHVRDARRLADIARVDDEHLLVRCRDY